MSYFADAIYCRLLVLQTVFFPIESSPRACLCLKGPFASTFQPATVDRDTFGITFPVLVTKRTLAELLQTSNCFYASFCDMVDVAVLTTTSQCLSSLGRKLAIGRLVASSFEKAITLSACQKRNFMERVGDRYL